METAATVVERFVHGLDARDLAAVTALYAPSATFEAHVPGWDTTAGKTTEIAGLLQDFFVGNDGFHVTRHTIVCDGQAVALFFDLQWEAAEDGAPCVCFQSHFFEVAGDRIRLQRMYCAGVRVYRPQPGQVPA